MKNTILIVVIAAFFAACNSQPKTLELTNTPSVNSADTAGLHEYQMYKQQKELARIIQTEGVDDGMNSFASNTPAPIYQNAPQERIVYVSNPAPVRRTAARTTTRRSSGGYSNGSGTASRSSQSIPAKKKGWSKAAKGTAIGGASGAVLGAIVSKKKGKGAIIGGVVGAAGGYILGRSMDKKDGRY